MNRLLKLLGIGTVLTGYGITTVFGVKEEEKHKHHRHHSHKHHSKHTQVTSSSSSLVQSIPVPPPLPPQPLFSTETDYDTNDQDNNTSMDEALEISRQWLYEDNIQDKNTTIHIKEVTPLPLTSTETDHNPEGQDTATAMKAMVASLNLFQESMDIRRINDNILHKINTKRGVYCVLEKRARELGFSSINECLEAYGFDSSSSEGSDEEIPITVEHPKKTVNEIQLLKTGELKNK